MKSLKSISDSSLINQLNKLVKQEHDLALEILPHLLEVEDRGLHLRAGYSSLYKYCVESLGFSESTAVRRIRAARCARQFTEVFRLLEQRKIKIVDAAKIRSVISEDNKKQLLAEMFLDRKDPERRADRREKRKQRATQKTHDSGETSRYISTGTRDAVYNRDKGRCTYISSNGKRCDSTWDLELHHDETPYAMGGEHSIQNLRLLCAAHNKPEGENVFGRKHMEKYYKKRE